MTDDEFVGQFESLTLPAEAWTHRAHVRLTYVYLERLGLDDALERIRSGIKVFNAHHGVPEGPLSGYNETTTVAFVRIVDAVRRAYATSHPVTDAGSFCDMHPQLLSKHILRLFYSPDRRVHPDAKTTFIEPDLAPLPVFG